MCHNETKRYECGSTNAERRILLLLLYYSIEIHHLFRKTGCATTTPNIQYAFMSVVLFRLILILLLYLLWMENAHITWLFSCYSIAPIFVHRLPHIYCVSFFLSLSSSYFIVENEFEIQTRIQNALLLLELGACAVVTRSFGFSTNFMLPTVRNIWQQFN